MTDDEFAKELESLVDKKYKGSGYALTIDHKGKLLTFSGDLKRVAKSVFDRIEAYRGEEV